MVVQTSYPGVYIDEFAPGAPIQGVGTSTAAFIGVASRGDIAAAFPRDMPAKVTSWDEFLGRHGPPVNGFYLWHAVRGFFENGGQICYVLRASNGTYAEWDLPDRAAAAHTVYIARARQPGLIGAGAATLQVAIRHILGSGAGEIGTSAFAPTVSIAAVTGRELTAAAGPGTLTAVQAAGLLRPGDVVSLGGNPQRLRVVSVAGDRIRLDVPAPVPAALPANLTLANEAAGARTIRLTTAAVPPANVMVAGTILTLNQGGPGGNTASGVIESVQSEFLDVPAAPPAGIPSRTWRVTFRDGLGMPLNFGAAITAQSEEITLTVTQNAAPTVYGDLRLDPAHPRYLLTVLNDDPDAFVRLERVEPQPAVPLPTRLPGTLAAAGPTRNGTNEDLTTLTDAAFTAALDVLRRVDDVNLVACPDRRTATMHQAIIAHCEQLADRFGVLDPPPNLGLFGANSIEAWRPSVDSTRGYAGLYYPWLRVRSPGAGDPVPVPPSGHVCGIIARSDLSRGVFKAPANEPVNGASGVERTMSDAEQGQLNLLGINVVRVFAEGGRPVLWGARSTATDRNWQYVSTRRLFLYLEESIQDGIRWAIFEPHTPALWQKLRRSIRAFLLQVWRDGGLFGDTADQAFYVKIDEQLNPFSEQALGRLHIEIGARPAFPAEFIVVRIGIWDGGDEVEEL